MQLHDLLCYNPIVIQCHDNPDADALASGFGVYFYLTKMGREVRFVYSGLTKIQKSNLRLMVEKLRIPIEYVEELSDVDLLVLVDCQYQEGNVTTFKANQIAVIDHHEMNMPWSEFVEIRSSYSSCSTLVYSLLLDEGFDVNADTAVATALYYGLYMDTNGFSEIKHPLDRDMMDDLDVQEDVITKLKNSNFSFMDLKIAGVALNHYEYDELERYAVVKANPCDPNILGFISDLVLQVEGIDVCVVYNKFEAGFKLSVRSCRNDATANDIIQYLTEGIGEGGGHKNKAGGYIREDIFQQKYPELSFHSYLETHLKLYFTSFDTINTISEKLDISNMQTYKKLHVPEGYVCTLDFAARGTELSIRTFEGDITIKAEADVYIMVGIDGEVYPIKDEEFVQHYTVLDRLFLIDSEYSPTVRNKTTQEVFRLGKYAKTCVNRCAPNIYGKQLVHKTKVFTETYDDEYIIGNPKDYLVVCNHGENGVIVIKKKLFEQIYEVDEEPK